MAKKTAKQILMGRGYTEADLAGMSTLLADAKFCNAIEAEAARADDLIEQNSKWYEEIASPAVATANQREADARAELAAQKERIRLAAEKGLSAQALAAGFEVEEHAAKPKAGEAPAFDPTKYVESGTFQQAFNATGDAIAIALNINNQHRKLFGEDLDVEGLLAKARSKKVALKDIWEQEYPVAAKRQEIAAAAQKAHDDAIRLEERNKLASEFGNPNTRPPQDSTNPFTRTKAVSEDEQPWRKSDSALQQARIAKVMPKVLAIQ